MNVRLLVAFVASLLSAGNAQLFKRCSGAPRCGIFSIKMHAVDEASRQCKESCVMFRNKSLKCGACSVDEQPAPIVAPSPVATTPVAAVPTPALTTPTVPTPVASVPTPVAGSTPSGTTTKAPVPGLSGGFKKPTGSPVFSPNYQPPVLPAVNGPFSMQLQLVGIPDIEQVFFTNAKSRWERVITGDLADFATNGLVALGDGCTYPANVDDLYICATYKFIDGPKGVLGVAGPNYSRTDGTVAIGKLVLEAQDVPILKADGSLKDTILHEVGHCLGLGTNWKRNGNVGAAESCPYTGVNANREYKAVSGCETVPTEQEATKGKCSHWDDVCLMDELMTGALTEKTKPILSQISVGSLEDLGYQVNYSEADSYTKDNVAKSCVCSSSGRLMLDMNHGETVPLGGVRRRTGERVKPRRQLSPEAHQIALDYGQSLLTQRSAEQRDNASDRNLAESDLIYVGDLVVSVIVQDGDEVFSVIVKR